MDSVPERFKEGKLICLFTCWEYPEYTFARKVVTYLEAAAIKTGTRLGGCYHRHESAERYGNDDRRPF